MLGLAVRVAWQHPCQGSHLLTAGSVSQSSVVCTPWLPLPLVALCPDCHFWVDVRDKCSGDSHCAACAVVAGPRFMCDVAIRDGLAVPDVPVAGHRPPAVS